MKTAIPTIFTLLFAFWLASSSDSQDVKRLTPEEIHEAYDVVLKIIKKREIAEEEIKKEALESMKHGVSQYHLPELELQEETKKANLVGVVNLELLKYFQRRYGLTLESISEEEKKMIRQEGLRRNICPKTPECKLSKYRTANGSCNNLEHPIWGKSYTPYDRLLPAEFEDGFSAAKVKSVNGGPLPSARLLSTTVGLDINILSKQYTHLMPLFGQFFVHDISSAAFPVSSRCCMDNPSLDASFCFDIKVPKNDYFYSQFGVECIPFPRAVITTNDCQLELPKALNGVTPVIDASTVYGSTVETANFLRSFKEGKLRSSQFKGVPPPVPDPFCNVRKYQPPCVAAGDDRNNMHTMLSELQQLWFREHNRIAGILFRINKHWDDETLYQESRRIVAAMLQHIVYNEFIPIIMGRKGMKKYGLNLQSEGFSYDYDSSIDPALSSEFMAAAMRFGHSLIQGKYEKRTEARLPNGFYELAKSYNWPIPLYHENQYADLLRGAATVPSQVFNNFFTHGLSNHFNQNLNYSYGFDLVAINTQRGRDVAIPSYTKMREFCNLKPIKDFDDLEGIMNEQALNAFRQLYSDVRDIEFYLGGLAEIPEEDEFVSPVIQCIIGRQFHKLIHGDRFWYENGNMDISFTKDQLNEIRKSSLARVICDNTNIQTMQRNSFHLLSVSNPLVPCLGGYIPRMCLDPWKETEDPRIVQNPNSF